MFKAAKNQRPKQRFAVYAGRSLTGLGYRRCLLKHGTLEKPQKSTKGQVENLFTLMTIYW